MRPLRRLAVVTTTFAELTTMRVGGPVGRLDVAATAAEAVDLVRAADGTLRLIELEIIEPQLYLRWDPGSAARLATALAAAARST